VQKPGVVSNYAEASEKGENKFDAQMLHLRFSMKALTKSVKGSPPLFRKAKQSVGARKSKTNPISK
jgi:hypothetical protein